jgi:hypothetical protein
MTATAKTISARTSAHPLEGSFGIQMFVSLVLVAAVTAFIVSSNLIGWAPSTKAIILEVYIFLVALGWFAFSASNSKSDFIGQGATALIAVAPVIGMVLTLSSILFWMSLIVVVAVGINSALDRAETDDGFQQILIAIYAAWVTAGLFITIGSTSILPYAESALRLEDIHILLSVRFLVTALVIVAMVGKSILDAYSGPRIVINPLPDLSIQNDGSADDTIQAILTPVITVLNAILSVVQKVTNAVWQVIALIAVFLYRTGKNLADHFVDLISNKGVWFGIARVVLTYTLIVLIAVIVDSHATNMHLYVTSDTSPFAITLGLLLTLIVTGILFAAILSVIVGECVLWKLVDNPLTRASLGGAGLLMALALSAFLLYFIQKAIDFHMDGFKKLGVYSILLLFGVGIVFIYQVTKRATVGAPAKHNAA